MRAAGSAAEHSRRGQRDHNTEEDERHHRAAASADPERGDPLQEVRVSTVHEDRDLHLRRGLAEAISSVRSSRSCHQRQYLATLGIPLEEHRLLRIGRTGQITGWSSPPRHSRMSSERAGREACRLSPGLR